MRFLIALLLAASAITAVAVAQTAPATLYYAKWQACLRGKLEPSTRTESVANAQQAVIACRQSEGAYLDALNASPLLAPSDVAAARAAIREQASQNLRTARRTPDPLTTGSIAPPAPQRAQR